MQGGELPSLNPACSRTSIIARLVVGSRHCSRGCIRVPDTVLPLRVSAPCTDFLHDYIFLTVGRVGSSTDLIAQHVEYVQQDQKRETVLDCVKMVDVSTGSSALAEQHTGSCASRRTSTPRRALHAAKRNTMQPRRRCRPAACLQQQGPLSTVQLRPD